MASIGIQSVGSSASEDFADAQGQQPVRHFYESSALSGVVTDWPDAPWEATVNTCMQLALYGMEVDVGSLEAEVIERAILVRSKQACIQMLAGSAWLAVHCPPICEQRVLSRDFVGCSCTDAQWVPILCKPRDKPC